MRASDIVGRLGGEEFAAIVPEPMDIGAADRRAPPRRLREGRRRQSPSMPIGATVSIGAATSHEPVTNIDALLARADAALYQAKHDGRNRCVCAA